MIDTISNIQGINIHTIRTAADNKRGIIFIHGNSSNAHEWDKQLDSSLADQYTLVSIDLPGHGQSDRSNNYSTRYMATLILELIDRLAFEEYILAGLSYGSAIIGEIAHKLKRCKGFCFVSANVTSDEYHPGKYINFSAELGPLGMREPDDAAINTFTKYLVHDDTNLVTNRYSTSYKATDPAFREAVGNAIATKDWTDEIANIRNSGLPSLVIFGQEEKALFTNYLDDMQNKWNDTVYHIPGAAHFVNAEQPETFNNLLSDFAADVFA